MSGSKEGGTQIVHESRLSSPRKSLFFLDKGPGRVCVWWLLTFIPALGRSKKGDLEFEDSLGYTARVCLRIEYINKQINIAKEKCVNQRTRK